MQQQIYWQLGIFGGLVLLIVSFFGGVLAARFWEAQTAPAFQILTDFQEEIPLIEFTQFDGRFLQGNFAGLQPRFRVRGKQQVFVPDGEGNFRLDLKSVLPH